MKHEKTLLIGAGGGLDIANCLPFYYIWSELGNDVTLASIRPVKQNNIVPSDAYLRGCGFTQITAITPETVIQKKGRYAEPRITKVLNVPYTYILSRPDENGKYNTENLAAELSKFIVDFKFDSVFFVDGGGDSMILTPEDAMEGSQEKNPLKGGDAFALEMISKLDISETIDLKWMVVAAGLDVNLERFVKNLSFLSNESIYVGSYDLRHLDFPVHRWLENYTNAAEKILKLRHDSDGIPSKTATTLYHSICGNYGVQSTFVDWEGTVDGKKGVLITPEQTIVYGFNPKNIHALKLRLNENRVQ